MQPDLPIHNVLIIEPIMIAHASAAADMEGFRSKLVAAAYERRDVWASRADALRSLDPRGHWDARVKELYVVRLLYFVLICTTNGGGGGVRNMRCEST